MRVVNNRGIYRMWGGRRGTAFRKSRTNWKTNLRDGVKAEPEKEELERKASGGNTENGRVGDGFPISKFLCTK